MDVKPTIIEDVKIVQNDVFEDNRGYFIETFYARRFIENGLQNNFVQDNMSFSIRNTLRGLHFQYLNQQAKLI